MADLLGVPSAELQARCTALEQENAKLRRINAALIERVESIHSRGDDAYAAFQHSVVLSEQVRERTDALNQAMAELKSSNQLLSDARLRAETAHQHLIDAIESISEGFILLDGAGRVLMANSRYRELYPAIADLVEPGVAFDDLVWAAAALGQFQSDDTVEEVVRQRRERMAHPAGPFEQNLSDGRILLVSERQTARGSLVSVRRDKVAIVHPITGELLGELDEEVATGRVVEVRDKFSVVEVEKAAAGVQVQVKDRVVLR